MSNLSEEHPSSGSPQVTTESAENAALQSERVDAIAPESSPHFSGPERPVSGPAVENAPQQGQTIDPFDLLRRAVQLLSRHGSAPFAAGVYSRMRQLEPTVTYGDFGFASFRELLDAAVERGVVAVSPAPRGNDVVVVDLSASAADGATESTTLDRLRPDLWDAFVNWNTTAHYAFDRTSSQVVEATGEISRNETLVPIPSADRSDQVVWMREFAASEPPGALRDALTAGLESEQPTRGFAMVLRDNDSAARRWKRYLGSEIMKRATGWAQENQLPHRVLEPELPARVSSRLSDDNRTTASRTTSADAAARDRILTILAKMPLSELLRLRIPLEYAMER